METSENVVGILEKYLDKKVDKSEYDLTLRELGLDSLDIMDFVFTLEKKYKLTAKIEDQEIDLLTLNKLMSQFPELS